MNSPADVIRATITALHLKTWRLYLAKPDATKTVNAYQRQLWRAVRALYNGEADEFAFIDDVTGMIDNQLNRAWREGALDVGVYPEDFTEEDEVRIRAIIDNEYNFVLRLADDILQAKANGDDVEPFRSRVDLWVNRYNEVVSEARVHFGGKVRLEWVKGATENHCATCSALDGIVAFGYEWEEAQFRPQQPPNPQLECEGWRCDCSLEVTEKRRTRNALNRLLHIAVSKRV